MGSDSSLSVRPWSDLAASERKLHARLCRARSAGHSELANRWISLMFNRVLLLAEVYEADAELKQVGH